jgi:hypothetical protein
LEQLLEQAGKRGKKQMQNIQYPCNENWSRKLQIVAKNRAEKVTFSTSQLQVSKPVKGRNPASSRGTGFHDGALNQIRTGDLVLTIEVPYLSFHSPEALILLGFSFFG